MVAPITLNLNSLIYRCIKVKKFAVYIQRNNSTDLLYRLKRRGLVKEFFPNNLSKQNTQEVVCFGTCTYILSLNSAGKLSAYAGFDATGDSLHVGNLLVLIALLNWQRQGYKTIVLLGDSTAEIGDPSGHKTDRKVLSREVIKANSNAIEKNVQYIFENFKNYVFPKYDKKTKSLGELRILRNSEWYESTSAVDFISQVGREIRIGDMLSRTSVKSRMESGAGMCFSEFSYQVFQSYDWLHLFKTHNCRIQFGGSDQLGNITSGYHMINNSQYQHVYGCLLPLVQSETGDKFGKTAGNAVYLSPDRTAPFEFYQYFMRLPDSDVEKFLRFFTFLSIDEIEMTIKDHMKNPDTRKGQKKLAEEVTLLVHGEDGLNLAKTATKILFQSDLNSLAKLKPEELQQVFPLSAVTYMIYEPGLSLLDLTMKAGCFKTEDDAKRIILGGGMYLNFEKMNSPMSVIIPERHVLSNGISLIRIGKKNYYTVIWK